ncbi:MAG: endo-1,4-beta-xylanase [Clostridia bacterium]|nr:endo-1,4-beta-xylanase [Clostridia bacterium]
MKIGASIGFQLIDIFNIMEDTTLTIDEKKQKILEYQRNLQTLEGGIRIKQDKGQNCKNGYYIFGNVDEMDYESLVNTKKYVDEVLTSFTCEGEMKMTATIAGYDEQLHSIKYNFSLADKIYGYAMEHGKTMRGHTLVWHKHQPVALDTYIEDRLGCSMEEFKEQHPEEFYQQRKELTKDFLSEYIKTMGERYPNCYCWDVLNEIVPDMHTGQPTEQERKDGIRHSKWMDYLGEEFYIDVLEIARDNLPEGTKLFYNEYGEQHPEKRRAILNVIEKIKQYEEKTGKTILDGIGMQSHYDITITPEQIEEIHRDFSETRKEIQITEVDIAPGKDKNGKNIPFDPTNPRYKELWNTLYKCAKEYGIQAFTCWGVNDDLSWFSSFDICCTMIDKKGIPKEYAQVFIDGIKQEKTPIFSEQQIGKGTINTPTKVKDAAKEKVIRDEQQIEQGELKK